MRWFVFLIAFCLPACAGKQNFIVSPIALGSVKTDGEKEEAWQTANAVTAFSNPWNKAVAPETSLQLLQDDKNLYFFFSVADTQIVLQDKLSGERDIEKEDRVELFFSKDKQMVEYYCFEIDAKGRTLSYQASHYRQFDFDWDVPEGYRSAAKIHQTGYTVEGAIPLSFLQELSQDDTLYFGAYRAEFSLVGNSLVENWLTWIDPEVAQPDFHIPASLCRLHLKN